MASINFKGAMALDPRLARCLGGAAPESRSRPADFEGLAGLVVAQRISATTADAILKRLRERGLLASARFLRAKEAELGMVGLDQRKRETLLAVAVAERDGALDYAALADLPDRAVEEILTAIPGIGPWTAQVFLLLCLGRPDVFPAGDYALKASYARMAGLSEAPTTAMMAEAARQWAPFRSAAAHILWQAYRLSKQVDFSVPD